MYIFFFFHSLQHQESVATTEARLRMEGVELKEEWQDEDFPRYGVTRHGLGFYILCKPRDYWRQANFCLTLRPLPEEGELDDDLFASTSEEQDTGN